MSWLKNSILAALFFSSIGCSSVPVDDYIWLEDSTSVATKAWVKARTAKMKQDFFDKSKFKNDVDLLVKTSKDVSPLPSIEIHGDYIYALITSPSLDVNRWIRHPLSKKYKKFPDWEVVLDFAKFSKLKKVSRFFKSAQCLKPEERFCLLRIADGTGDLVTTYEFDTKLKKILPNSFAIPTGRTAVAWLDKNHVAVAAAFDKKSETHAGLGNQVRVLKRGVPSKEDDIVLTVDHDYIGMWFGHFFTSGSPVVLAYRSKSQLDSDAWILNSKGATKVPLPRGTEFYGLYRGFLVARLRSGFQFRGQTFRSGDLVGIRYDGLAGPGQLSKGDIQLVFRPKANEFLEGSVEVTKDFIFIELLKNVRGQLGAVEYRNGQFTLAKSVRLSGVNTSLVGVHFEKNLAFVQQEDFLLPSKLSQFNPVGKKLTLLKSSGSSFDSSGMVTLQRWAKSIDGTRVPYFLVGKKDRLASGSNFIFLGGYGGYGFSMLPTYDPIIGKLWLERGGVYVVANIRGGGELGPEWHKSAVLTKKQRSIDDFLAVARDLTRTGVTTSSKIGAYSGSLGSLVVGGAMVQGPSDFGAIVASTPVFDLVRGDKLISGNWKGEVGDPKIPEQLSAILDYSPYQNLHRKVSYPSFLSYVFADDQRVHPAHARKMVQKMRDFGNDNIYYLELDNGGHFGAPKYQDRAFRKTAMIHFFQRELGMLKSGR